MPFRLFLVDSIFWGKLLIKALISFCLFFRCEDKRLSKKRRKNVENINKRYFVSILRIV